MLNIAIAMRALDLVWFGNLQITVVNAYFTFAKMLLNSGVC